jgi:hypothetical protein
MTDNKRDTNIEKRGIGVEALQLGAGVVNLVAGGVNLVGSLRKPGSGDSGQGEATPPKIELPPGVDPE